jgi:26S proteasome regulatory subunit N7
LEKRADWERRNRLKVYHGLAAFSSSDFKTAAQLILGALSTFYCTELMPFHAFVQYAVLAAMMDLSRNEF